MDPNGLGDGMKHHKLGDHCSDIEVFIDFFLCYGARGFIYRLLVSSGAKLLKKKVRTKMQ